MLMSHWTLPPCFYFVFSFFLFLYLGFIISDKNIFVNRFLENISKYFKVSENALGIVRRFR